MKLLFSWKRNKAERICARVTYRRQSQDVSWDDGRCVPWGWTRNNSKQSYIMLLWDKQMETAGAGYIHRENSKRSWVKSHKGWIH